MARLEKHQEQSLGELLLQSGRIKKEQLEKALAEQERTAEPLGKTLIRLGFAKEEDILHVLQGLLVVTFTLAQEMFAFEALFVREIIRYQPLHQLPQMPDYVEGLLRHRESILSVINLTVFLGHTSNELTEDSRIIIAEIATQLFGLRVDAADAVIQLPMDQIENVPAALNGLQSKYIYGVGKYEGKLITVLNLSQLFSDVNIPRVGDKSLGAIE